MLPIKKGYKPAPKSTVSANTVAAAAQDSLHGLSLGEAIDNGLIKNDDTLKFANVSIIYPNGDSYSRIALRSNVGNIRLSDALVVEMEIKDWMNKLEQLVFVKATSDKGREYFQLQKPRGEVVVTVSDVSVTEMEAA